MICKDQFILGKKNKKSPCIDHDHKSGKIRGILCDKCNRMLGFANDSYNILIQAAEYLKTGCS
jgi:hypothetical protein